MCHDPESRPPAPPHVGAVSDHGSLTLHSADGTDFSAAFAMPSTSARAAIVVLPDVRGLHGYYIALTKRLAEAGSAAIAFDYFGRTAGLVEEDGRSSDFDFKPHIAQTDELTIDADVAAAIDAIRNLTSATIPVLTLGFCFGGSNAWRQAAGNLDLAGCMGFYGQPGRVGAAAPLTVKPTLMLIAGDDVATPVDDQLRLAEQMRSNGATVVDVVFPGAPHSFFDRSFTDWTDACDEAWRAILAFTESVTVDPRL